MAILNTDTYIGQQTLDSYLSDWLSTKIPIGTLIETTSSTSPASVFGGTWELYGQGQVTVGINSTDSDFSTAGSTGGEKTVTLTLNQIPYHDHSTTVSGGYYFYGGEGTSNGPAQGQGYRTAAVGLRTGNAGSGQPHNNLQPYIVVYRWKKVS